MVKGVRISLRMRIAVSQNLRKSTFQIFSDFKKSSEILSGVEVLEGYRVKMRGKLFHV